MTTTKARLTIHVSAGGLHDLDDLAAQAARDAWNRRQEAEHAKLQSWNTAARQFGTVQP